ncbi:Bestrophin, RFP-TM, chloride channel-domain-containing protein [Melanogaster broomeanus]|nr:Bestrophin, RFP-TM, chloride channel-domain-containing protein [Melanogaster broomeanus]
MVADLFLRASLFKVAIFRSWRVLTFFGLWAATVCSIHEKVHSLAIQPTLLTVGGTVLGFVISFRTTTSYDRYNEGRRLWAQIVGGTRSFARVVWFHVPENATGVETLCEDEAKVQTLIEKKTVINLLEGYAVAITHYLRGEDGASSEDVLPFIRYLPPYDLPPSIPPHLDADVCGASLTLVTCVTAVPRRTPTLLLSLAVISNRRVLADRTQGIQHKFQPHNVPPIRPPGFSFKAQFLRFLEMVTSKAPKKVPKCDQRALDKSSYIAALEARNEKLVPRLEPPTMCKINLRLPFQILDTLGWFTIPATILASFMFFGFLVAGAEIENPFGYDKNDLVFNRIPLKDMHFIVHNIVRKELHAITSMPPPNPRKWAFSDLNSSLFPSCDSDKDDKVTPSDVARRGKETDLRKALRKHVDKCCD